jgi:PAS domain S-box-containing protein
MTGLRGNGTRIELAFGFAVLLVLIIGLIGYRVTSEFVETADRVAQTHHVQAHLEELFSQLKDVADGAHGYVITGAEEDLVAYGAAKGVIDRSIANLRELTVNNRNQQQRLDALEEFVEEEVSVSQQAVDARAAGGLEAGVQTIQSLAGRQIMDSIRTIIEDMKAEEWELLRKREREQHATATDARRIFALLTFIVIVLLAAVAYLVRRDAAARQHTQETLQAAYERLDRRVEERTAELAQSNALLRREIADHKRAKEARQDSEERYRTLFARAHDGIFVVTPDGQLVEVNESFARMHGYSVKEMLLMNLKDLDTPEASLGAPERMGRVLAGENLTFEVEHYHRDGYVFPLEVSAGMISSGGKSYVQAFHRDISERVRAERELRDLERLAQQRERLADIGAITAQIVHDLGNPLAGLSMQAQLVLHRARRDERQPVSVVIQPVERILAEVRRLDSLIKEFMDFSREQRLDLKAIDLSRFLKDVVEIWRPVAMDRGIVLNVDVPHDGLSLTADDEKLRRVLDNLVKNAIEAIDSGPGQVEISVSLPAPDAMCILVSDTGPGIPESVEAFRLFETTKVNGSGLGLAVVKQIVLAHRGTIGFSRLSPHGTVFRIELPRSGPMMARSTVPHRRSAEG